MKYQVPLSIAACLFWIKVSGAHLSQRPEDVTEFETLYVNTEKVEPAVFQNLNDRKLIAATNFITESKSSFKSITNTPFSDPQEKQDVLRRLGGGECDFSKMKWVATNPDVSFELGTGSQTILF